MSKEAHLDVSVHDRPDQDISVQNRFCVNSYILNISALHGRTDMFHLLLESYFQELLKIAF